MESKVITMKTLVLVSHPKATASATQTFLKTSADYLDNVTWRSIDDLYSANQINIVDEQKRLRAFDRIIFQFPMYWYTSPASLKQYMDDVFTRKFIVAKHWLKNKELGLVITLGDSLADFQAGGREQFTISELMKPFEAFANKAGMVYLKSFIIDQFGYLNVLKKQELLVSYLQYLSAPMPLSLEKREKWLITRLKQLEAGKTAQQRELLDLIIDSIDSRQDQIDDLKLNIKMIRDQEE